MGWKDTWDDVRGSVDDIINTASDFGSQVSAEAKRAKEREQTRYRRNKMTYLGSAVGFGVGTALAPKLAQELGMGLSPELSRVAIAGGVGLVGREIDKGTRRAEQAADEQSLRDQAEFDRVMRGRRSIADASVALRRRYARKAGGFGQAAAGELGSDSILGA